MRLLTNLLAAQNVIARWVEDQQEDPTHADGSVELLEFQGYYAGAVSVDQAVTWFEEDCEVIGLAALATVWILLVGLLSEWELKHYLGLNTHARVGCSSKHTGSDKDLANNKSGRCCGCLHPASWSAGCRQCWVKHAACSGNILCLVVLAVVAAAVATAFAVPDPDLLSIGGGTAQIKLVIRQNIEEIPADTQLRIDFRTSLNNEISRALSIPADAVVTMEIGVVTTAADSRRQMSTDTTDAAVSPNDDSSWGAESDGMMESVPESESAPSINLNLTTVTIYILPSVLNESSTTKYADEVIRLHADGRLLDELAYPIISRVAAVDYVVIDE
eukprot:SAG22_NODE_2802_length_2199_cov_1.524286_4_plen_330_part_01